MILPSEDRVFPALEDLLSWTSKRQQALAANVANLDTPGYQAKDYSLSGTAGIDQRWPPPRKDTSTPLEDTSNDARHMKSALQEKPNGNTSISNVK